MSNSIKNKRNTNKNRKIRIRNSKRKIARLGRIKT